MPNRESKGACRFQLAAVVIAATYLPAQRAANISPIEARRDAERFFWLIPKKGPSRLEMAARHGFEP
jgi:hypothetical protein